ncbi:hypothetical protein BDV93DRAFT_603088 [Ceratobasidium sp. AG-I]|nr:hypothetical protein BDV93DRAFT_603088 [Ceratobasidium sp. AG-I]
MTYFSFAYTVPFPKESKITQEQAFEGLRLKARAPTRFIPMITGCEVLDETPNTLKRKVTTKSGASTIENIEYYGPSLVLFKGEEGNLITNLISVVEGGSLLLTFTFSLKLGEDGNVLGFGRPAEEMKQGANGAVEGTMKTLLELLEEGKLN